MPTSIPGTRSMFQALATFHSELGDNYQIALDRITAILARYADVNGRIRPENVPALLAEVDRVVSDLFVGPDGRNAFGRDGITPLSPYARILNEAIANAVAGPVQAQANFIQQVAPDLVSWLRQAKPTSPRNFAPDYESPHTWVDPNGYTLNDRIWRAGVSTRLKMDGLLTDSIRQGKGSREISGQLERFLLPDRANLRTSKPYGVNASFDGMRLARTEIARAHGTSTMAASEANPWVDGIDWALSPSHHIEDECNDLATIDAAGSRIADPYHIGEVPPYPPHPQDMCSLRAAVITPVRDVIALLRGQLQAGAPAPFTPANPTQFVAALLGTNGVQ